MYLYNLGLYFEYIVNNNKNYPAIKFSHNEIIKYGELNAMANKVARFFLALDIKEKEVICISGEKTTETFAGIIACLKIGAAYSILDPYSPVERLKKILNTCLPKIVYCDEKFAQKIENINKKITFKIINYQSFEFQKKTKTYAAANLNETAKVTGTNPAYIMFTSGSTGFPKGALMTHDNVLNFIKWSTTTYRITENDIFTNVNPLYFDNSVFDIYSSLFSGACIVPFEKETVTDPKLLVEKIDDFQCTCWFSVPSMLIFLTTMKALNKDNMKYIKRFIFGGEGYPKSKLRILYDLYSDRAELYNVYGPTECTCICSSYKLSDDDFLELHGFPPLGDMIPNFSYLILDENNSKVAKNEVGELCLLGPQVGRGYYNDSDRTRTQFVQNPFNRDYEDIMYKTGDLVRYNSDDNKIWIMGRKDNQIKHMGYRIELEEIETALCCLDYISQAAVLHGNARGLSQIIAVVSTKKIIEENIIRKDLKNIIPDYMVPTVFHFEGELPKNPNGKIDKKFLQSKYL